MRNDAEDAGLFIEMEFELLKLANLIIYYERKTELM